MTDAKRLRVRQLFLDVADLPAAERRAALSRSCQGDPQLQAEVEALLRADESAGGFLAAPTGAPGSAPPVATAAAVEQAGA